MPSLQERIDRKRKRKRTAAREKSRLSKLIHSLAEGIKKLREQKKDKVPGNNGGWHPNAIRNQVQTGIGSYINVAPKIVWHTTEGSNLPSYSGSHPHFTIEPESGKLYQHIPITSGAMALLNASGGVETNRANCIQVEIIGTAASTQNLSDKAYRNLASLARWIEKYHRVPRKATVRFQDASSYRRLSGSDWYSYAGHCGHQHVPENDHWDPGKLNIAKVLS